MLNAIEKESAFARTVLSVASCFSSLIQQLGNLWLTLFQLCVILENAVEEGPVDIG